MAWTTVGEGAAVNTATSDLLGWHADRPTGQPLPSDHEVLDALRVPVRASYRLSAGWSPEQLDEAGPLLPRARHDQPSRLA